jgi:aminomethyltransferase
MVPAYHSLVTSSGERPRQTPLHLVHERLGAKMTSFAGWQMPLRYASETAEHHAVRRAAGLFDLSHMGEIAVTGPGAGAALDYALTGYLSVVPPGRARYTMICAPDGGVLDDLVVYRQGDAEFLVIANAANTATVVRALTDRAAGHDAEVADVTSDYALIAVQGPAAAGILAPLAVLAEGELAAMKYYAGAFGAVAGVKAWVARTGYTGEDGFEIYCRPADAEHVWTALASRGTGTDGTGTDGTRTGGTGTDGTGTGGTGAGGTGAVGGAGLVPAGLAARDTLRLEAGMPLYGNELGPDVTPFEAGLGRVVKFDKPGEFAGRQALSARASSGPRQHLAGLTIDSRRIARHGYPVLADGQRIGTVTSGAPSPTLGVPIAMAYLDSPAASLAGAVLTVGVRGEAVPAHLTDLPFYSRRR